MEFCLGFLGRILAHFLQQWRVLLISNLMIPLPSLKTESEKTVSSLSRVTLRDIGNKLGLSHATISLCLRDHPSIPLKRRQEVRRVAEEMGYCRDPWLSSLLAYRNRKRPVRVRGAIAWINQWTQPQNLRKYHEFDLYWQGATESAELFGYHLEEFRWNEDYSSKRIEQILLTRDIRGILIPPHRTPPQWGDFDWQKFAIIRFGMSVPTPDAHVVTADQQRAVLMAFRKMSDYGYRRIGLIVSADYDSHLGGNFIGGLAAAQDILKLNFLGGLATTQDVLSPKQILPPLRTDESLYFESPAEAKRLLSIWLKKYKPDAILTSLSAVPYMIKELGYDIPGDIAVAGTTTYDVPVDAGINQNPKVIGRVAIETLVAQINRSEFGVPSVPCRILVESLWQDGKSMPPKNAVQTAAL